MKNNNEGSREMLNRRINKYLGYRKNLREIMRNEPENGRYKSLYFRLDSKIDCLFDKCD